MLRMSDSIQFLSHGFYSADSSNNSGYSVSRVHGDVSNEVSRDVTGDVTSHVSRRVSRDVSSFSTASRTGDELSEAI